MLKVLQGTIYSNKEPLFFKFLQTSASKEPFLDTFLVLGLLHKTLNVKRFLNVHL